ncbi:MAG: pantetheine-phosphate adenylyltransferase [Candidatus Aenigmatarchaeota archaeon]
MAYAVVGGTFNCLHPGHEEIMRRAFSLGGSVLVCLTSDAMAKKKHLPEKIEPYDERKRALLGFLSSRGWLPRTKIVKITDPFTEGLRPSLTHIVASEETKKNAEMLNVMRIDEGLSPLEIVVVDWVMAQDGHPVSGVRIRKGEIGRDGRSLCGRQHRKESTAERSVISPA